MIVSAKMNNVFFSSQNLARIGQVKKKIAHMHVYHQTKCLKLLPFKSLKNSEGLWQKVKIRHKTICPNSQYWKKYIDNCIPDKIFCTCKNLTIAYMYMINFICQHSLQWTPF